MGSHREIPGDVKPRGEAVLGTRMSETVKRGDNLLEQQPGRGMGSCSRPAVVGGTSRGWSRESAVCGVVGGVAEQSRSLRARQGCGGDAKELQWGRWEEGLLEEFPVQSCLRALGHRVSPRSGLQAAVFRFTQRPPPRTTALGCQIQNFRGRVSGPVTVVASLVCAWEGEMF